MILLAVLLVAAPALSPAVAVDPDRPAANLPVRGPSTTEQQIDGTQDEAARAATLDAFDPQRRHRLGHRLAPGLGAGGLADRSGASDPRPVGPLGDLLVPSSGPTARPGPRLATPSPSASSEGPAAGPGANYADEPIDGAGAASAPTQTWQARFATPDGSIDSFPTVASGSDAIYAAGWTMEPDRGFQATVVRVDPGDGTVAWKKAIGGTGIDTFQAVAVHDGTVYLAGYTTRDDIDLLVVALDAETGQTRWEVVPASPERPAGAFDLAVTDDGSRVVATGFALDRLGQSPTVVTVGVTASGDPFVGAGQLAWIREVPVTGLLFTPSVDVAGGRAYVATESAPLGIIVSQGLVLAYEATTGAPLWRDVSAGGGLGERAMAVDAGPDRVAVGFHTEVDLNEERDLMVRSYEPVTGNRLWSRHLENPGYDWLSAVHLGTDGTVYATGRMEPPDDPEDFADAAIVALDGATGATRWRTLAEVGDSATDAEAITQGPDGHLYVAGYAFPEGDRDRAVLSLDAGNGSVRWTRSADSTHEGLEILRDVTTTPQGQVVAAGVAWGGPTTFDGQVQIHDPGTGNLTASRSVNGPAPGGFDFGQKATLSPDGETVFVTGQTLAEDFALRTRTVAYDADSGTKIWSALDPTRTERDGGVFTRDIPTGLAVSPDGSTTFASVITEDGFLRDGLLLARDAASGDVVWTDRMKLDPGGKKVEGLHDVAVDPDGETVYGVGGGLTPSGTDGDATAVALDAATGDRRWTWASDSGDREFTETVAVDEDGLYVGVDRDGDSEAIIAVGLDPGSGTERWRREIPDVELWDATLDDGVLVVAGSRVQQDDTTHVRTSDAVVAALDTSDGSLLWNATFDELDSWDDGQAVTAADGRVLVTGRTIPKHGTATGHIVNGNDVFVAAYDLRTGTELWTATADTGPPEAVRAFPEDLAWDVGVVDGTVLTAGMAFDLETGWDQLVLAHDAATGEEVDRWRFSTPGEDVAVSVAVSEDRAVTTGWSSADYLTVAFEP